MLSLCRCFSIGSHERRILGAGYYEYNRPGKKKQTGLIELS